MKLDLRQLRYFLAVAETGVMAHAAQKLNVAQSALSHHVAEIERRLGVKLIERHARGITLTVAGQRLSLHARSILRALADAEQDVRAHSTEPVGPVVLGMAHTVMAIVSLGLMSAVRAQLGQVVLGLVEGLSPTLVDRLLAASLDLAVVFNPPSDARLNSTPLLEEDLYLVGRPDLLQGRTDPVPFDELEGYGLVLSHPSLASAALIESALLRNRLPRRIMEVDSLSALTNAVVDGIGCTIVGKATLREGFERGMIAGRRIVAPELTRTLCVSTLSDAVRTPAAERVRAIAVDLIRSEVAAGAWDARLLPG